MMINIEIISQDYCSYCDNLTPKKDLIFNQYLWCYECVNCYRGYS